MTPGLRIGSYEIVAALGAGGMGEVYRARDTKLNREVALKVLPEVFALDAERLARFTREAQVLASLNHPHIAAIYGIEEQGNTRALVMELVEGDDLSQRIARGAIPLDEALPLARQIAVALEAAHEQGIVHRDLKPANIKVRDDGTVKVLDFGLAKALDPAAASASTDHAPTITSPAMTMRGVVLGTPAYMSPEQAKGKAVDRRADIWAFGAVLFEMLAGTRAFEGDDVSEVMAGILKLEPHWTRLPADLPEPVRRLLRRCLEKDPKKRLRDVAEGMLQLEDALAATSSPPAGPATAVAAPQWRRALPVVVGGVLTALAAGAGWTLRPSPLPSTAVTRFAIALPLQVQLDRANAQLAISRDGRRIVSVGVSGGRSQLYVRSLDQLDAQAITGVDADVRDGIGNPFFSPDSEWVGFQTGPAALSKVRVSGGSRATLCEDCRPTGAASWGAGGTIVFSSSGRLMKIAEAGGTPTPLTTPQDESHLQPHFLPDGQSLLFTVRRRGSPDRIAALSLSRGEQRELLEGASPRVTTDGYIVFQRQSTLWAVAVDPGRLAVVGEAAPVLEGVLRTGMNNGTAVFDLAAEGTLVYSPDAVRVGKTLVWVDRRGQETPIPAPRRGYATPRLSPDGTRVALMTVDQDRDIWIWDIARESLTRLTFDKAQDSLPVWTPDGRRIVFASSRGGASAVYWQRASGTGPVERLTEHAEPHRAFSFTPDGLRLVIQYSPPNSEAKLSLLELNAAGRVQPLLNSSFAQTNGHLSPDGRWLAYMSNESGRHEVYIRPFPDVEKGRWQISTGGGSRPVWARSGRELFYVAASGALMAVPIRGVPTLESGSPVALFDAATYFEGIGAFPDYDVSLDGQRFLMVKSGAVETAPSLVVVQDWLGELRRAASAK